MGDKEKIKIPGIVYISIYQRPTDRICPSIMKPMSVSFVYYNRGDLRHPIPPLLVLRYDVEDFIDLLWDDLVVSAFSDAVSVVDDVIW